MHQNKSIAFQALRYECIDTHALALDMLYSCSDACNAAMGQVVNQL